MATKQLFRKLVERSNWCRTAPSGSTSHTSFDCVHNTMPGTCIISSVYQNYGSWQDCEVCESRYTAFLHCGKLMDDEDQTARSRDGFFYSKSANLTVDSLDLLNRDFRVASASSFSFLSRSGKGPSRFAQCQDDYRGRTRRSSIHGLHIVQNLMQSAMFVRFSSTSGERLEDELGGLSPGLMDVSSAEVGGVIESVGSSEAVNEVFSGVVGSVGSAQAFSEVTAVIGDCSYPTGALQLLIESVHLHAGIPWWAAIAVTTALIRLFTVPVIIYQTKAAATLSLMRPELEKINAEIKDSGYDPSVTADARQRLREVFKKHKTSPFSPFIGGVIQAPVFMCFFFGIKNMADRIDSFKYGGFLWFMDLSTADSTYILPLITALSVLITVEIGAADGMEGNPMAGKMKTFMRIFSVALFPLTMNFEKALFCYWITSSIWAIIQSSILKIRSVKARLGIPDLSHLAQEQAIVMKSAELVTRPPRITRRKTQKSSRRR